LAHQSFAMSQFPSAFEFVAAVLRRPGAIALLVVGMVLAATAQANAGIVTSMDAVACSSLDEVASQAGSQNDSERSLPFRLLLERPHGFDHPLPTSNSTTGGATGPGMGPMQSPAACVTVDDVQDSPARGWAAPEATLALPPLLPSGLFRPPRNSAI
jgi:hypothetical protein